MSIKAVNDFTKRTGRFESFDGTQIYYEVRGQGRPIVLCYGIACLTNHWTHQLRYFSRFYQTIVFDYRGHQQTPPPKDRENLNLESIARDAKALLDHLEIEKASFWGHSYGALLLLRYYELFPQTVENLVFINGFARHPLRNFLGIEVIEPALHLIKDTYQALPTALSTLWKRAVLNPMAIPLSSLVGGFNLQLTSLKDIEVYARGVAAMDLAVFLTLFEEMVHLDETRVLEKIKVPTLIISGMKDGVTPFEQQLEMQQKIPNSQLLRVPYGSHCTQLDMPDFVNLRIEKFLAEEGFEGRAPSPIGNNTSGKTGRKRPWHS